MQSHTIALSHLQAIYRLCARAHGATDPQAELFSDCLSMGDLRHPTQGASLFCEFLLPLLQNGRIHFHAPPLTDVTPSVTTVDAGHCAGQIIASHAMDAAIERADLFGIGMSLVRNAGDIGMASVYAMRALRHNAIGVVVSRGAAPLVAPWGSSQGVFGTNPISVAVPSDRSPPIVVDMSPAVYSVGTLVEAARQGAQSRSASVVDLDGEYLTEPAAIVSDLDRREPPLAGFLLPEGVKASALLVAMEMLAGGLNDAQSVECEKGAHTASCCLIAIQPAKVGMVGFNEYVDRFIERFAGLKPAKGFSSVLLPGQRAFMRERERRMNGIPVRQDHWETLCKIEMGTTSRCKD
jgi:LDH2 family malate/lactate/ureidoglycolate dehydrogenase